MACVCPTRATKAATTELWIYVHPGHWSLVIGSTDWKQICAFSSCPSRRALSDLRGHRCCSGCDLTHSTRSSDVSTARGDRDYRRRGDAKSLRGKEGGKALTATNPQRPDRLTFRGGASVSQPSARRGRLAGAMPRTSRLIGQAPAATAAPAVRWVTANLAGDHDPPRQTIVPRGTRAARLGRAIFRNLVSADETRTAPDEPERHRVFLLSFECSSGEGTPGVPGFSSGKITIHPQHSVREVPVQTSVRAFQHSRAGSKPVSMTVPDLDSDK